MNADSAILMRTATNGSMPGSRSNCATSGCGFFSANTQMVCVPGSFDSISMCTMALFSAMSGARITTASVSTASAAPIARTASAAALASNASLLRSVANARSGASRSAASAPPIEPRKFLRSMVMPFQRP